MRKYKLVFTKVNGELREMIIIDPEDLTKDQLPHSDSNKPKRKVPDNIVHVYEDDVGWKSFRAENLVSCELCYLS